MIVECHVWCVENLQNRDLGLPEGDIWMPVAINFKCIQAIKMSGQNEFTGNDKAVVYFDGDYMILDIPYIKAIELWKQAQQ